MSRAALAKEAGVNETTVLRIERGDVDPRIEGTWAPIARALMAAEKLRSRKARAA
jgi:DNA-binding XRE family transcriptional regulator